MSEQDVRSYFEKIRWPEGPTCIYCHHDKLGTIRRQNNPRDIRFRCRKCRKQFTVTVGTVLHGTNMPLKKWLMAYYYINEGISGKQLQEKIEVTYKVAWSLMQKIKGMKLEDLFKIAPVYKGNSHQKYFFAMDDTLNWYRIKSEYRRLWSDKVNKHGSMSDIVHPFYAEVVGEQISDIDFYLDDDIQYFFAMGDDENWYLVMSKYRKKYETNPDRDRVLNTCVGIAIELIDFYLLKPVV